ncbi:MAG: sugar ABC transporter substrate-binding protein [Clostridia bacterium]|nr:sugar ABC transporter substrate-binding protein [Clostridia bacterium]
MKKVSLWVAFVLIGTLLTGALGSALAEGYQYNVVPKEEVVIGFNNGSTTVDFLRIVGESMERAAEENGVKILVAESAFETERILANVESLLMQGANVIVDFNVNAEVGGSLVDYCGERGVPVVGIDVAYPGVGDDGWFFGANNQMAGETAGWGLAQAIKAKWDSEIEYLVLFFNSENGDLVKLRLTGIADGLRKEGIDLPEENVVLIDMGGGCSDTTLVSNQKMTDWLTAHPDAKKIGVGTVNPETGQGVFSAVQTANRDSDVFIVTNNNAFQTLAAFEQGENCWVGGSAFYPNKYGDYVVPLCVDILAGNNPDKIQVIDHSFLGRDQIADIYGELGEEAPE